MNQPVSPIAQPFTYERLNRFLDLLSDRKTAAAYPVREADGRLDVMVELPQTKAGFKPGETLAYLKKSGLKVEDKFLDLNAVSGKIEAEKIKTLQKSGFTVYDNSPRELLPPLPAAAQTQAANGGQPWELPQVDPAQMLKSDLAAKNEGLSGQGVNVAVIDSGFNHPSFQLAGWKDLLDNSPLPVDPNGHGTHVAGDVHNIAPGAGIVAVRAMGPDGSGKLSDIFKGIQWAIENKDRYNIGVINLSLSCPPTFLSLLNLAVQKAVKSGIAVTAAAGNNGPGKMTVGSPGEEPSVITVGSARDEKNLSDFSSRGPTVRRKIKPDVTAPGEFIVSWIPEGSTLYQTALNAEKLRALSDRSIVKLLNQNPKLIKNLRLPENILELPLKQRDALFKTSLPPVYLPERGYMAGPGTSFASPEVAGVAALMREKNPQLAPGELKAILMETAEDMGNYKNTEQGAGFVNAQKALERVKKTAQRERPR